MATRKSKATLGTARMAAADAAASKARLVEALNPGKVRVSGMFHAILAVLLGQENEGWTRPALASLCILSDGGVLGMRQGDIGYNDFLCGVDDLRRNIVGVCEACGVSDEDRDWLLGEVARRQLASYPA